MKFPFQSAIDRVVTVMVAVLPITTLAVQPDNPQSTTLHSVLEHAGTGSREITPQNVIDEPATAPDFSASQELNRFLTGIVLENIPHQYVEDKKWGKQSKRWDGIDFRRDDDSGKLETKRRYKMVNHGTWEKYSAQLIDPQQQFSVSLQEVSRTPAGLTVFQINFVTLLKIEARQSEWVKGVQLYSVSAEGQAKLRLNVRCELGVGMDLKNFPPDLVFSPTITDAQIIVDDFRLNRVSKVGGEVAQQISRLARKELDKKIEEKERKLVAKLNEKIARKQDQLRLSAADAIKLKWYGQTRDFLPEDVDKTLGGIR